MWYLVEQLFGLIYIGVAFGSSCEWKAKVVNFWNYRENCFQILECACIVAYGYVFKL